MPHRVFVIGAGPGGLAAALLLRKAGLEVTVLERSARVGGRTSAIAADGFRFDVGPTSLIYPEALEAVFRAVGRDLHAEVELRRLDPLCRFVFGRGGQLTAPSESSVMASAIRELSDHDGDRFGPYMNACRRTFRRVRPCLERPFPSIASLLSREVLGLLPSLHPSRSLNEHLRRFFRDPRVRPAMSFQTRYLGMSPASCPSVLAFLAYLEHEGGVYHPVGGCSAITERMAAIAREMGVDVRLEHEVLGLMFEGRRAVGLVAAGREFRCDAVVINADFSQAMTRLVPADLRRKWSDARIAHARHSCSTFMLYLGIEGRCEDLAHHTIYISRDYERNLRDIEERHVLSDDASFHLCNPCVTDPGMAPPGMSTLTVLVPVPYRHPNVPWIDLRARVRGALLRSLERLGLEDIEARIRFERIVTPADWEEDAQVYRGATYGLAHTLGQLLHRRPQNRFEELDAVYLVGGSTHPGGSLPLIFDGARISARLLLQDLGVDAGFLG